MLTMNRYIHKKALYKIILFMWQSVPMMRKYLSVSVAEQNINYFLPTYIRKYYRKLLHLLLRWYAACYFGFNTIYYVSIFWIDANTYTKGYLMSFNVHWINKIEKIVFGSIWTYQNPTGNNLYYIIRMNISANIVPTYPHHLIIDWIFLYL